MVSFTLAEVLIVLGIIGLIADMTIPTLHQNITAATKVAAVKKAYSTLENAFRMTVAENGTPDTWDFSATEYDEDGNVLNNDGSVKVLDMFKPYLNIMKECKAGDICEDYGLYSLDNTERRLTSFTETRSNKVYLADGSLFAAYSILSSNCSLKRGESKALQNTCGEMALTLKVNNKKAYQGKDRFFFYLTKYGIIPMGTQQERDDSVPFGNWCNMNKKGILNGYGCAAWVIYNGNMDYLKCNDLSWGGKTRCK